MARVCLHRERHVVESGKVREQRGDLERAREAERAAAVGRQRRDVAAGEPDASGIGSDLACKLPDQRGLAGAVRTDDDMELAFGHIELDLSEATMPWKRLNRPSTSSSAFATGILSSAVRGRCDEGCANCKRVKAAPAEGQEELRQQQRAIAFAFVRCTPNVVIDLPARVQSRSEDPRLNKAERPRCWRETDRAVAGGNARGGKAACGRHRGGAAACDGRESFGRAAVRSRAAGDPWACLALRLTWNRSASSPLIPNASMPPGRCGPIEELLIQIGIGEYLSQIEAAFP